MPVCGGAKRVQGGEVDAGRLAERDAGGEGSGAGAHGQAGVAEAGGDHQALDAGHRAEQRALVGRPGPVRIWLRGFVQLTLGESGG